jgi:hypothetical protein
MSTSRNSGILQQDSIINKFKRDARSNVGESATQQAIRAGREARAKFAIDNPKPKTEVRFVAGSPAEFNYLQERKAAKELAASKSKK